MLVSVLMTTYNQAEFVERAVRSVLDQTYQDFELLVTDDGSTDATVNVLARFDDPRMWVVQQHPTPEARAQTVRYATLLNRAGELSARGRFVTFLCGDDYFMPTRLERMIAKAREGHDVVYGPQLMLDESGRELGVRPAPGILDDAWHRVDLNSVLVAREAFKHVGGFDDRPATPELWRQADAVLWRKLTDAGYRFVPVDGDEPTDAKTYREQGVDARVIRGETPWTD